MPSIVQVPVTLPLYSKPTPVQELLKFADERYVLPFNPLDRIGGGR
jgi:hypothetical protein